MALTAIPHGNHGNQFNQTNRELEGCGTVFEGRTYRPILNQGYNRPMIEHAIEYCKSANGAFRVLQLLDKICKVMSMVLKELGSNLASSCSGLSSKFSGASLIFPRLLGATNNGYKAIVTWGTDAGSRDLISRGRMSRFHTIADSLAAWLYASSMILESMLLKNVADLCDFTSSMTDLVMAAENYNKEDALLDYISDNDASNAELKSCVESTMVESCLRFGKSSASVISGGAGLLVLGLGSPVLSATALLVTSLISTIFSIVADFYKAACAYERLNLFELQA